MEIIGITGIVLLILTTATLCVTSSRTAVLATTAPPMRNGLRPALNLSSEIPISVIKEAGAYQIMADSGTEPGDDPTVEPTDPTADPTDPATPEPPAHSLVKLVLTIGARYDAYTILELRGDYQEEGLYFYSTDERVATVSQTGFVEALAKGTTDIRVTYNGEDTGRGVRLRVTEELSVSPTRLRIREGERTILGINPILI